jgi:hypothetical protein
VTEKRASVPRFRRVGPPARIELTDDDVEILRRVFQYRFVRAADIFRLFPDRSPDKLSRRLARLYRSQHLDRPLAQIERFGTGGSKSLVYGLDNLGARLLAQSLGLSVTSGDWKSRNRTYTRENLDHTLSVARFLIDLELACRARDDADLIPFEEIVAAAPEATRLSAQPGRWKVPVRWNGTSMDVLVIPDAILGLRRREAHGPQQRSYVFLEVDRGTMTIAPAEHVRDGDAFLHRTSILRKLVTYATSHQLELQREHLGIPAARVLTLTTTGARAEAMQRVAQRFVVNPLRVPAGLFLFGVQSSDGNPLEIEWINAAGAPVRLLG